MGYLLAIIRLLFLIISLSLYLLYNAIAGLIVTDPEKLLSRLKRSWCQVACFILGLKVHLHRPENLEKVLAHKTPILCIANHRSFIDPVVIMRYLDVRPLSKASVTSYPLLGYAGRTIGTIFVERTDKTSRKSALKGIENYLRQGDKVLLFPEGTTTINETTGEFRPGTFLTAAELDIPILPLSLHYEDDYAIWDELSLIAQYFNHFKHLRSEVHLDIGELKHLKDVNTDIITIRNGINKNILRFRSFAKAKTKG